MKQCPFLKIKRYRVEEMLALDRCECGRSASFFDARCLSWLIDGSVVGEVVKRLWSCNDDSGISGMLTFGQEDYFSGGK